VSRLVYMMALLEAVLWIQPNFALSWQHDMTKLLQTQTDNLNQLAQNVAKDNIAAAMLQKQAEIVARELEMVARANVQIRNTQTALLDKGAAKQASSFNPTQNLPQLIAQASGGGDTGNNRAVAGKSAAGAGAAGATSGAVPLMSSSQASAVACCIVIAIYTAFSHEFNNAIPESSDSDASAAASPAGNSVVMKRLRDEEDEEEEESDDECVTTTTPSADVNNCRRGRKRARLGVHAASSVHFGQDKNKNNHKRTMSNDSYESPCFSDDSSIACSPTASIGSGAVSPQLSPVPTLSSLPSTLLSTLPPEMACDFELEHALYCHGIARSSPVVSAPMTPVHPCMMPEISASPVVETPIYEHAHPRVIGIDPALLMEPSEHSAEDDDEEEEAQGQTAAAAATTSSVANGPLFGIAMEPMVQDVFY